MDSEWNLLVVEDDPVDAGIIRRLLERDGGRQHVETAGNMEAAKERLRHKRYDAVLLDLGLPDAQGLDAVMDMQASAPELPIVVLSGNADADLAVRSVDLGAEDYIVKDQLNSVQVERSLRYAVERHRRKIRLFHDNDALWRSLQAARHDAETDTLTGIANRRGLERYLLSAAAGKDVATVTALVMDLDHFKDINDRHGHDVGDAVLREAAVRMLACLGGSDFIARVGGDEFVALLRPQGRRSAVRTARRILASVYEGPFNWAGRRLNISVTVAMFELTLDEASLEQILAKAHPLLIRGKNAGRARLEMAWREAGMAASRPAAEAGVGADALRARTLLSLDGGKELGFLFQPGFYGHDGRNGAVGLRVPTWLESVEKARRWLNERQPQGMLHLDFEARLLPPGFAQDLRSLIASDERGRCVLYFHSHFSDGRCEVPMDDIRQLRNLGFQIGVRGLGDGFSLMENLVQLGPQWIRFDPSVTLGLGRFKEKSVALECLCRMVQPLHAHCLAEDPGDPETLAALRELGFEAYCKL